MSLIPIVDLSDTIIWHKERADITTDDVYRVSACRVVDGEGNILLAQRAFTKKHNPGKRWPAVAGTVEQGETYIENICKEIQEETGIRITEQELVEGPKDYTDKHWKHFTHRYLLVYRDDKEKIVPEVGAVEQMKWFTPVELEVALQNARDTFVDSIEWWLHMFPRNSSA